MDSVRQEFRQSIGGWSVFAPQCLYLPPLGRLQGQGWSDPRVTHSLACLTWPGNMKMGTDDQNSHPWAHVAQLSQNVVASG